METVLHNAKIVTSEKEAVGTIVIEDGRIAEILWAEAEDYVFRVAKLMEADAEVIELESKYVMAGGIDAHVHFREPGLTHKADMETESRAAVAGGVTFVFDMPNTNPPTVTAAALRAKIEAAKGRTVGKIGFHIGATNDNADKIADILKNGDAESGIIADDIAGVKVFMGSSTGNMLVDRGASLDKLFAIKDKPVLVHSED